MGRFDERATRPARGPRDMLRWRFGKRDPLPADFAALDRIRPALDPRGPDALASGDPVAVWIGHATWAFRVGGLVVVTDPIFSTRAGGVIRRLVPPAMPIAALPPVDLVLVTHDHHDHMDPPSLRALPDDARYVVGLGNGERVRRLGKPHVIELDWWDSHREGSVEVMLVPARHWSMRAPWNRNDSLWGGFVVRGPEGAVYHAGDTAWAEHFAEIGRRAGPIDWAMLPIGGYAPRWFMEPQHVDPEEAGAAFEALGAHQLLAMHWGTFKLTDEAIGEPPARLRAWWQARGMAEERLVISDIGEPLVLAR